MGLIQTGGDNSTGSATTLFYNNFGDFPATGAVNYLYVAKSTAKLYEWDADTLAYVEFVGGSVTTPTLIIETNTTTPTGVLANAAAFTAAASVGLPNFNLVSFEIVGTTVKIEVYGMPNVAANLFDGNTEIVSYRDLIGQVVLVGIESFKNSSIVRFSLPSLQYIRLSGFEGCSSLGSIIISNLWKLGASAFKDCTVLDTLIIPNAVSYENDDANIFNGTGLSLLTVGTSGAAVVAIETANSITANITVNV
jgi:BspA type Leucine rich repeat region (6 copies)